MGKTIGHQPVPQGREYVSVIGHSGCSILDRSVRFRVKNHEIPVKLRKSTEFHFFVVVPPVTA
jgi:hypothetical protein